MSMLNIRLFLVPWNSTKLEYNSQEINRLLETYVMHYLYMPIQIMQKKHLNTEFYKNKFYLYVTHCFSHLSLFSSKWDSKKTKLNYIKLSKYVDKYFRNTFVVLSSKLEFSFSFILSLFFKSDIFRYWHWSIILTSYAE